MSIAERDSAIVRLEWSLKDDGDVIVVPCDEDRFILRRNRAIAILQQGAEVEKFGHQFNILLRALAAWLRDRQEVKKAYLTDRDGALAFVVVRTSCSYDDDFEDAISELDFRIANDPDLDLIKMDVIALPLASDSAVSSFVNPEFAFVYVGNGNRSGSYCASQ